ncbi:MAG: FtsX-like permease family protein, partial [Caulobacteraceae bacterium]
LRNADRGFRREGLILVESLAADGLGQRQTTLLDAFRRVPGIVSATLTQEEPGLPNEGVTGVTRPGRKGPPVAIAENVVGEDYLRTLDAKLLAGRDFDRLHRLDDTAGLHHADRVARGYDIILDASAAKVLGFSSPREAVGQPVKVEGTEAPVIGVIKDIHFGSPRSPAHPVFYRYDTGQIENATGAVRFAGVSQSEMMARLEAAWRRAAPETPFKAKTAEAGLADFYRPDEERSRLFSMGAVLAVLIGCVGLYGLASFTTARRVKEIGIRKTLGASTGDILRLLIGQFLRPVLLANLIAWPLAYLAMRSWLSGFDERIALSPVYFLAATALTLAIALATVAGQAFAVARADPGKALRHE